MNEMWVPSPNHGPRRDGAVPDMVVLHYTAMASAEAALERLCYPGPEVSAHWLVGRDGRVWHLVAEERRAWHAGRGAWGTVTDVNSRSIGIEIDNDGRAPFSEPAMAAVEVVLRGVMARWSIRPERVIGHSDMAPGRKVDPGPRFDWRRLVWQGLAVGPVPVGNADHGLEQADIDQFCSAARRVGYTAEAAPEAILHAFRTRFRPGASGPVTAADVATAEGLARRYPVDAPRRGA